MQPEGREIFRIIPFPNTCDLSLKRLVHLSMLQYFCFFFLGSATEVVLTSKEAISNTQMLKDLPWASSKQHNKATNTC